MGNTTRLQNFMRHKDQQGSEESSLDQCQRRDQESSSSSYLLMHEVTLVFIHFLILSRATGGVGKVRVNPHEFEKTKTKKTSIWSTTEGLSVTPLGIKQLI